MGHVTVLTAGTGGARLVAGVLDVRPEEDVHVVASVASDYEVWGLYCCPDIDVILDTLSGESDPYQEGADKDETFSAYDSLRRLGTTAWAHISDRQLATHLLRTEILSQGSLLDRATEELAERLGIGARVLPATNGRVRTMVRTEDTAAGLVEYKARRGELGPATGLDYEGAEAARGLDGAVQSILEAERVILAPSHPVTGVGSLLAIPDVRNALIRTRAGVVAISPFVGSQPARGVDPLPMPGPDASSLSGFALMLRGIVDSIVVHSLDVNRLDTLRAAGMDVWVDDILLDTREDAARLAGRLLYPERLVARKR